MTMRIFFVPIPGDTEKIAQANRVLKTLERAGWDAKDLPLTSDAARILQEAMELWARDGRDEDGP